MFPFCQFNKEKPAAWKKEKQIQNIKSVTLKDCQKTPTVSRPKVILIEMAKCEIKKGTFRNANMLNV